MSQLLTNGYSLTDALSVQLTVICAVSAVVLWYLCLHSDGLHPGLPVVGMDDKAWFKYEKARQNYIANGKSLVEMGVKQLARPFQIVTGGGTKVILPARFAQEIKNIKSLSFTRAVVEEFFAYYPGFEPFTTNEHGDLLPRIIRVNLTQSLNLITNDLSEEAAAVCHDTLGETKEWTELTLKPFVLQVVARLSARVFVGPELCQNQEWLEVSKNYAVDAFMAARALRRYPFFLRRVIHWFVPECQQLRRDLREARQILKPIIEQRLERNRQAAARGENPSKIEDTIGWLHEGYQEQGIKPDLATSQLALAMAAIHTTTELLTGCMLDLFAAPHILEDVRDEMKRVLDGGSWKKTTLYQLKLLDSVLKESQRLHTRDVATMRRVVEEPLELSDGTKLPKGAFTMVSFENLKDTAIHSDPEVFNPRRFLDMRQQPGQENKWQLVSTSPEHLAFGHGLHACPGRFFASNEVKVALCHLLLKYDWKYPEGINRPKDIVYGSEMGVDGRAKVLFRRREEEVPL